MKKQPRGGAGNDLILFIFFIIVLGIVWAVSGGPEQLTSTSGPFFSSPFGNDDGSIPGVTIPDSGNSAGDKPSSDDVLSTERLSPYAGLVQLTRGRAKESDVNREYVQIKASGTFTNPVPISSWHIESSKTRQGAALGGAALLPSSSGASQEAPLMLTPGATLYVVTGRSPIDASFRINLCTGYFEQNKNFEPSLRTECPRPVNELAEASFSPNASCTNFIEDMRRCEFADTVPDNVGQECRAFIQERLTYSGCVTAHKDESGFYRNEWRVYLKRSSELWNNTDERIRLLDENGFLVDVVSY